MSFKLTKAQIKARDEHVAALDAAQSDLMGAVAQANERIAEINDALTNAVEAYNEKLTEARDWRDEIMESAHSEYEEKSERWQETDNGGTASQWIEAWTDIDLDDVEGVTVDVIEFEEPGHKTALEEAPEDPNS